MSPSPADPSAISWQAAGDDVFVATADGEYAGFTAGTAHGTEAHGPRGEQLGVYPSTGLARAAVGTARRAPIPTRPRRVRRRGTTGRIRGPKE
jgi:hypothetical protein